MSTDDKLKLVDPSCTHLSVSKQCQLLGLSRSRFYYKPKGVDKLELEQMRILYKQRAKEAWIPYGPVPYQNPYAAHAS